MNIFLYCGLQLCFTIGISIEQLVDNVSEQSSFYVLNGIRYTHIIRFLLFQLTEIP